MTKQGRTVAQAKILRFPDSSRFWFWNGIWIVRTAALTIRALKEHGHSARSETNRYLAAEYPARTNYLYLTYSGIANDVHYLGDRKSIVVLGSGAYRIGSSVEFDWCGVQALNTIRKEGYHRSVMINYTTPKPYLRTMTCATAFISTNSPSSASWISSNWKIRMASSFPPAARYPTTSPCVLMHQRAHSRNECQSIDNAEDRDNKFSAMLDRIGVDQPEWRALTSLEDINDFVGKGRIPGAGSSQLCAQRRGNERLFQSGRAGTLPATGGKRRKKHPVVVSQFIEHAKEVEMDAVAQNGKSLLMPSASILSLPVYIPAMPLSSSRRRNCMWRRCAASSASVAR